MGSSTGNMKKSCVVVLGLLAMVSVVQPEIIEAPINALKELNEDNWSDMLKGEWMVEFFAPWCPACKSLAPTWERFADVIAEYGVNVAKIDVTTSPSLSGRFFVTALPTIYHVHNGDFRQYRGARDGDALTRFIKLKQWKSLEKISSWKNPDTFHMSVLSYFFKLSHTLKDFNTRLQEEYGLPSWCSYAFFAVGTVFIGATLGLMLVCVVDFLYPPKRTPRQSFDETKKKILKEGIEEIADYDLEDDNESQEDGHNQANDSDPEEEEGEAEGTQVHISKDNKNAKKSPDAEEEDDEDSNDYSEEENEEEGQEKVDSEEDKEKLIKTNDCEPDEDLSKPSAGKPISSNNDVRKRKPRKAD